MLVFDYEKTMKQVQYLRQIANDMTEMSRRKLGEALDNVQNGWKGQSGQQFLSRCSEFKNRIEKEAERIYKLAADLEAEAKAIDKEESEAARVLGSELAK